MESLMMNTSIILFSLFWAVWCVLFILWILRERGVSGSAVCQWLLLGLMYGSGLLEDSSGKSRLLWWHPVVILLVVYNFLASLAYALFRAFQSFSRDLREQKWRSI